MRFKPFISAIGTYPELLYRHPQSVGHFMHPRLAQEHTLRPTETSKCRVRMYICLTDATANMNVWNVVAIVAMTQGSFENGGLYHNVSKYNGTVNALLPQKN